VRLAVADPAFLEAFMTSLRVLTLVLAAGLLLAGSAIAQDPAALPSLIEPPFDKAVDGDSPQFQQQATAWIDARLKVLADKDAELAERLTARNKLIANIGTQQNSNLSGLAQINACQWLRTALAPHLKSPDRITATNAAIVASNIRHPDFAPLLGDLASNGRQSVRYHAARGLAAMQPRISKLNAARYFETPLGELADQAVVEPNGVVASAIYGALKLIDPRQTDDPGKRQLIYKAFQKAFEGRVKLLDQRKLGGLDAELTGLDVAEDWRETYRDKATLAWVLRWEGQLLRWSVELLLNADAEKLSGAQRDQLADLINKALDNMLIQTDEKKLIDAVRAELTGDPLTLQLKLFDLVGAEGAPGALQKNYGVEQTTAALTPPTTQPED
jgi:hypothetical protein